MPIFYDLETTGLNQFHDKITEMCFHKYYSESEYTELNELVNPEVKISYFITNLTGISNEMVSGKPTFQSYSNNLVSFLSNQHQTSYLVAHNNDGFDKLVLKEHFKRASVNVKTLNIKHIDTLLFAKKMYPEIKKFSLVKLCEHFNIELEKAHRAKSDTIMLTKLYKKMVYDYSIKYNLDYSYVFNNPSIIYEYIYE